MIQEDDAPPQPDDPMTHLRSRFAAVLAAAVLAGACDNPGGPHRPGEYTLQVIGVPPGASSFTPADVDERVVVGAAEVGGRTVAARWSDGAWTLLNTGAPAGCDSEATAISGGSVAGEISCGADTYGWATGITGRVDPAPHTFVDINAEGTVAGTRGRAQADLRAFVARSGSFTVLLPPGAEASAAAGIADDGEVAVTGFSGCGGAGCTRSSVWVWRAGEWSEAPLPRGADRAEAVAASSEGHVAGFGIRDADQDSILDNDLQPVFLWERGDDLEGLPVIPGTRVVVRDVASSGFAVGSALRPDRPAQPTYGVIWGKGRLYYLTERMMREFEDWQIEAALGIDDKGHIAGIGTHRETGETGAVLLIPVNPP
jgi:hypothetical protein